MTIYIMRTGISHLPLHSGQAPRWLFTLMVRLVREVLGHVVSEYAAEEVPSAAVGPIVVSTVRLPIGIRLAFQRSDHHDLWSGEGGREGTRT